MSTQHPTQTGSADAEASPLERAIEELERRVAERTAELADANEALEEEVAEHEAAKEELIQRTRELEGIFQALPDLYFRFDRDGRILDYRAGGGNGLYVPPEEFLGRRLADVLPPHVAPRIAAGMEEVAATGRLAVVEYSLPLGDEDRDFEARLLPLDDGTLISVIRDDTVRKRAQRALRDHATLLEAQNHAVLDGILVAHEGRVLSMNARFADLFNVPAELRDPARGVEMLRWARSQAADPEAYRAKIEQLRADPEAFGRDEVELADGRVLDRYTAPVRAADGVYYGRIWTVRDITERKRVEEELRLAKEEAERANSAKSEFLSRMSHELRTPMNSILGFAQLLARGELPAQQAKSVQHILKAGRHLLNLINEVLEISRIEAGRQNFSLEPVRVGPVLHEAIGLVRPLAAQWGVDVEEGPWPNGEIFVRADRQRMVQVLLNLLSNAIKYNRPRGRVRLTCATLPGGRIALRVEDTGRGIPAEHREQLFTPFSRLGAEQGDVEGTGLGLALSQRLCEAMGGALLLESSGPEGTTFRVELAAAADPVARLEEGPAGSAPADDSPHHAAVLLYVEDNLANLSLVETILLSRPAWRTVPALQGQLGVELAREHRPNLILLDLHLPDISGEEVLRRLRADERTAGIPVVVISADATAGSIARLRAAGADAYLTKPLDVDEFLATVDRFLAEARR